MIPLRKESKIPQKKPVWLHKALSEKLRDKKDKNKKWKEGHIIKTEEQQKSESTKSEKLQFRVN